MNAPNIYRTPYTKRHHRTCHLEARPKDLAASSDCFLGLPQQAHSKELATLTMSYTTFIPVHPELLFLFNKGADQFAAL